MSTAVQFHHDGLDHFDLPKTVEVILQNAFTCISARVTPTVIVQLNFVH